MSAGWTMDKQFCLHFSLFYLAELPLVASPSMSQLRLVTTTEFVREYLCSEYLRTFKFLNAVSQRSLTIRTRRTMTQTL